MEEAEQAVDKADPQLTKSQERRVDAYLHRLHCNTDIYNDMERTQQLCEEREPFDVRIAKPASDQEHGCPPV